MKIKNLQLKSTGYLTFSLHFDMGMTIKELNLTFIGSEYSDHVDDWKFYPLYQYRDSIDFTEDFKVELTAYVLSETRELREKMFKFE